MTKIGQMGNRNRGETGRARDKSEEETRCGTGDRDEDRGGQIGEG